MMPTPDCRCPGHDLAVVGVNGEGDADHLAVPAGDFEAAGGPTAVRGRCDDGALMGTDRPPGGVRLQGQRGLAHEAEDPLAIDRRLAGSPPRGSAGP